MDILFYEQKNGRSPVYDWLEKLKKTDKKQYKKVAGYLDILSQLGRETREPYVKHLQGKIYELRPQRNRILFFFFTDDKIVLLNQFVKKTNKTPDNELKKAEKCRKDFIERVRTNENVGRF
ncbi:toxin-antitoxin system, toxin component, RelE family [Enterococcus faecalis ATCC 29200]|uniref:type II toxin-antitoxin system RelE/ParE family toxin n=1 Tax=Enterococcus faecalis TaxID=1351 RepID=UPI00019F6B46|nr:type II toxin-antitoxin system RelE/ParE family toxin [Enterococcus faecalis]EEN70396.1 toxin-antitoxin system, toxin component, RelE family [Enterococcus faecalis ATCC 29200]EOJ05960.1 hypothetical protein UMK_02817 [Enterococcus faecalis ATCC 29200]HDT7989496.1 type II toxin-antitoxin system RelE/ParE family toxin [Enterococcus faecalis]HDT8070276.1 type II toxin-antitoxin system RelE/ParE family toxin [Enterococcus faecalis]